MTCTVTSQNIDLSSWDTLYKGRGKQIRKVRRNEKEEIF
jgi:hypothetical protein